MLNKAEQEALEKIKRANEIGNIGLTEEQLINTVKFFSVIEEENRDFNALMVPGSKADGLFHECRGKPNKPTLTKIKEALEQADTIFDYLSAYHSIEEIERWLRYLVGQVEEMQKTLDIADKLIWFTNGNGEPVDGGRFRELAVELRQSLQSLKEGTKP